MREAPSVVVISLGFMGLLNTALALHLGARPVIAADRVPVRCARGATLGDEPNPAMYQPFEQEEVFAGSLVVRASTDPESLLVPATQIVRSVDPTVPIGKVTPEAQRLMEVTRQSLDRAIEKCVPGNRLEDIGWAVQEHVEENGFSVVRKFVGHGIGKAMHEDPPVPNFGRPGRGHRLRAGLVIAIEPMVNAGTHDVEVLADNWTAVTKDRRLSAHFEHSVAITENGPFVLSRA